MYLAQFGVHSTYGKQPLQGNAKLEKSLELLYQNYNHKYQDVFYADETLDFDFERKLTRGRPSRRFEKLNGTNWKLPQTDPSLYLSSPKPP